MGTVDYTSLFPIHISSPQMHMCVSLKLIFLKQLEGLKVLPEARTLQSNGSADVSQPDPLADLLEPDQQKPLDAYSSDFFESFHSADHGAFHFLMHGRRLIALQSVSKANYLSLGWDRYLTRVETIRINSRLKVRVYSNFFYQLYCFLHNLVAHFL